MTGLAEILAKPNTVSQEPGSDDDVNINRLQLGLNTCL